eukprot:4084195-Alexandrium_andersonii.AAC.1
MCIRDRRSQSSTSRICCAASYCNVAAHRLGMAPTSCDGSGGGRSSGRDGSRAARVSCWLSQACNGSPSGDLRPRLRTCVSESGRAPTEPA